ncbi:FUSC family protein [Acinetobacter sp. HY1485]|uniref:FUSC family protein n=1 Tax=Acinetobacter sp. HY1485 TaxID=2970918 RepID=UPI0022B9A597|nr:FUSC family protein [Acinetobacter sp. HY1485]
MQLARFEKIIYISKILCCGLIITCISIFFNKDQISNFFLWGSLTAFSSIQSDLKNKVNFNQIIGNLIGSVLGVLTWLILYKISFHYPMYINIEYLFLVIGILVTTTLCVLLKHAEYCGIALAGFLIVTVYDVSHHTIEGALFRVFYCATGCLIAYCVDNSIRFLLKKKNIQ